MAVSREVTDHVRDLFSGLGPIEIRRMFGSAGVYLGDAMFALITSDGEIYLRGDDNLGAVFEASGAARWVYRGQKKPVSMPYWQLPEPAMEDPDEALHWARQALIIAEQAAAEKRARKAR